MPTNSFLLHTARNIFFTYLLFAGVESVPVMTVVRSSESVRGHLEDLLSETSKLDIRRLHREAEAGLEADEIRENIDALRTHCQLYAKDRGDMQ